LGKKGFEKVVLANKIHASNKRRQVKSECEYTLAESFPAEEYNAKSLLAKSFCPRLPKSSNTYNHVQSLAYPKANISTQFRLKLETHVEISDW